jgi:hypothetical protein
MGHFISSFGMKRVTLLQRTFPFRFGMQEVVQWGGTDPGIPKTLENGLPPLARWNHQGGLLHV